MPTSHGRWPSSCGSIRHLPDQLTAIAFAMAAEAAFIDRLADELERRG
jgi:hypothetical protein